MASGPEMMVRQLVKWAGVDPEKLMGHVEEMKTMFLTGFLHAKQANERLARIERHLGLAEIEPIPTTTVIIHEKSVEPPSGGIVPGTGG